MGKRVYVPRGSRLVVGEDGQAYLVGSDGRVTKSTGESVKDSTGKPLRLARDEELFVGKEGQPFVVDGKRQLVGPDGEVMTGEDGRPLAVPLGSRIITGSDGQPFIVWPDGTVVGPDGKVVTGASGKPLQIPMDGSVIVGPDGKMYGVRADGTIFGPDGRDVLDSSGQPYSLPAGSKLVVGPGGQVYGIREDGKVVGPPDGGLIMGYDGRPLRVSPGEKLVFDSDGHPLVVPIASRDRYKETSGTLGGMDMRAIDARFNEMGEELDRAKQSLKFAEERARRLQQKLIDSQGNVEESQLEYQGTEVKTKDLEQRLRDVTRDYNLEFEISTLRRKLTGEDVDMAETVNSYIREQRDAMNDQLDARKDDNIRALAVSDREKKILSDSHRDATARLKAELDDVKSRYEALEETGVTDQTTLDELDMMYKQSLSRMEDQNLALRAEIDRLQEELASAQNDAMMSLGSGSKHGQGEMRPTYKDGRIVYEDREGKPYIEPGRADALIGKITSLKQENLDKNKVNALNEEKIRQLSDRIRSLTSASGVDEGRGIQILKEDTAKQLDDKEQLYARQMEDMQKNYEKQISDSEFENEQLKLQLKGQNVIPLTADKLRENRLDAQRELDATVAGYKENIGDLTRSYEEQIRALQGTVRSLEEELQQSVKERRGEEV